MIRIGILGDIGAGKSYVANNFGYPVFNADNEVSMLYKKDRKIFNKLNKKLPDFIFTFPINKLEIIKAILSSKSNLKKINRIVHSEVRNKLKLFIRKNKKRKIIILDIPLLLENKINRKKDILVYVETKETQIKKKLKKRLNFNHKLYNKFKKIQFSSSYKKKKSDFIIKNNFTKKSVKKGIRDILNQLI